VVLVCSSVAVLSVFLSAGDVMVKLTAQTAVMNAPAITLVSLSLSLSRLYFISHSLTSLQCSAATSLLTPRRSYVFLVVYLSFILSVCLSVCLCEQVYSQTH